MNADDGINYFLRVIKSLAFQIISCLIIIGWIFPFFLVAGKPISNIVGSPSEYIWVFLLLCLLLPLISSSKVMNYDVKPRAYLIIVGCLLGVYFIFSVWAAYNANQGLYSDFNTMWETARSMAENGMFTPYSPQTERPIVFLLPLALTFGGSQNVFEIFNILLIVSSFLMVALIVRRHTQKFSGLLLVVLLMLSPEIFVSIYIPTHDLYGSFLLVLGIFVCYLWVEASENRNWLRLSFLSIALYIVLLGLEVQRGLLIPIIMAIVLLFIFAQSEDKPRVKIPEVVFFIIVTFSVFYTKSILIKNQVLYDRSSPSITYNTFSRFCNSHSESNGTFAGCRAFHSSFGKNLSFEEKQDLWKAWAVLDLFGDPIHRVENYADRIKRLTALGTQKNWYIKNLKARIKGFKSKVTYWYNVFNLYFVALFGVLGVYIGLNFFRKSQLPNSTKFCMFFGVSMVGLLGLFGENQPRYLYPLYFTTIIAGAGIIGSASSQQNGIVFVRDLRGLSTPRPQAIAILILLLLTLSLLTFGKSIAKSIVGGQFVTAADWTVDCKNYSRCDLKNEARGLRGVAGLSLRHPSPLVDNGQVIASAVVNAHSDQATGLIFIRTPYVGADKNIGSFELEVYVDQGKVASLSLDNTDEFVPVRFQLGAAGQKVIRVVSKSNVTYSAASWSRASRFEIFSLTIWE